MKLNKFSTLVPCTILNNPIGIANADKESRLSEGTCLITLIQSDSKWRLQVARVRKDNRNYVKDSNGEKIQNKSFGKPKLSFDSFVALKEVTDLKSAIAKISTFFQSDESIGNIPAPEVIAASSASWTVLGGQSAIELGYIHHPNKKNRMELIITVDKTAVKELKLTPVTDLTAWLMANLPESETGNDLVI